MDRLSRRLLIGLAAATVPMTAAMRVLHDRLPNERPAKDHEPLPPQMITHRMARWVGSGACGRTGETPESQMSVFR